MKSARFPWWRGEADDSYGYTRYLQHWLLYHDYDDCFVWWKVTKAGDENDAEADEWMMGEEPFADPDFSRMYVS